MDARIENAWLELRATGALERSWSYEGQAFAFKAELKKGADIDIVEVLELGYDITVIGDETIRIETDEDITYTIDGEHRDSFIEAVEEGMPIEAL